MPPARKPLIINRVSNYKGTSAIGKTGDRHSVVGKVQHFPYDLDAVEANGNFLGSKPTSKGLQDKQSYSHDPTANSSLHFKVDLKKLKQELHDPEFDAVLEGVDNVLLEVGNEEVRLLGKHEGDLGSETEVSAAAQAGSYFSPLTLKQIDLLSKHLQKPGMGIKLTHALREE